MAPVNESHSRSGIAFRKMRRIIIIPILLTECIYTSQNERVTVAMFELMMTPPDKAESHKPINSQYEFDFFTFVQLNTSRVLR